MRHMTWIIGLVAVSAITAVGCGRGDKLLLADAGGTVTYNGDPLEGATVVFVPDSGLPATGITDAEGRFTWNTRGDSGAVVGLGKVTITAVEQLIVVEGREPTAEELANMSRSLLPEKYGHPTTSELSAEVKADEKNEFTYKLSGPTIPKSTGGKPKQAKAKPQDA
jgi:hypothetical protein